MITWPNEFEHKTRIPLSQLPDNAAYETLFKCLTDNVGEEDVAWKWRKNEPLPGRMLPPVKKMNNLNLSFVREEDKVTFILKWC